MSEGSTGEAWEPGGKARERPCQSREGGEMRGSTCVIAMLLLMVVFLQTFFLESISSSDAEENAG